MALITHQTQGLYQPAFLQPISWTKGIKLRSSVVQLFDRTNAFIPEKNRLYLRCQPIKLSKGKLFQVLSFKGNAQNDESTRGDSCSKFTKTPVQFSHTQEEIEAVAESPDEQNHPIPYDPEDGEDSTAGSLGIQRLFRKWLLMLRTQSLSPADQVLDGKIEETRTSDAEEVVTKKEAGQLLRSAMVHFLKIDAAISLPLLIFIPFYLTVRIVYGAEVTKELTPMWVLGPLIVALYVKIFQGLYFLYVFCFMTTFNLVKNLPSYSLAFYNFVSEGKLKEYLYARFWKPVEDVKNLDYKQFFIWKMKQLQEWVVEMYLDYVESIWPYYCRAIRFLKKCEKPPSSKRGNKTRGESVSGGSQSQSQHAAGLVLEAIYLKAVSLQKLGKATEAAQECKNVLDAVEKMFQNGISEASLDTKLQDAVSKAVELLPELWKQAGKFQEALVSYRRALLSQWNLNNDCCARIQKRFAVLLLYGGVEACPPSLAAQTEGSFVPKNNLEEAILLLMILLRKWHLGKIQWDPSILEHFTFALALCDQTSVLARHFEELMPGTLPRCGRWNTLALCYSGAGQDKAALNLLRKSLNKLERPNDIMALLLAAKICSEDCFLAYEGVEYSRRALENCQGDNEHLKSAALRHLGISLEKQAKIASSDQERSRLQAEALKSLDEAITLDRYNPDLIFDLGLEYAQHRNTNAALRCAEEFIDATGGSILKGWKFHALVLSTQQRYLEAEVVTDAALDETAKWEQGDLLRIKAKLKVAQNSPMDALEAYRLLLALVQARRKSFGSPRSDSQVEEDKSSEFEVWQGLANLYSSLSYWKDAEVCLDKARALKPYSAAILHAEGLMYEAQGEVKKALASYSNALSMDLDHVASKVSLGALLWRMGSKSLPVGRSLLSDALRIEPTNRMAWYYLGMIHKDEGRLLEAADCFQASAMLEESDPVESFSSIS